MPIDNEKIKQAMDDFENDNFIKAKDTIKKEIHGAVNDYFKDKLELEKDLDPKETADTEETEDTGETGETDTGGEGDIEGSKD